ncbi:hypothetical protein [Streptomyces sp. ALB3]|uniref:hypothetical protein n=1 Tax=Streptomyces sp. ALB3 TaxID=3374278 RepID=UPI003796B44A
MTSSIEWLWVASHGDEQCPERGGEDLRGGHRDVEDPEDPAAGEAAEALDVRAQRVDRGTEGAVADGAG